jgi:hypothetical protein
MTNNNKCPECKSKNFTSIRYVPSMDKYLNRCDDCDRWFYGKELRSYDF